MNFLTSRTDNQLIAYYDRRTLEVVAHHLCEDDFALLRIDEVGISARIARKDEVFVFLVQETYRRRPCKILQLNLIDYLTRMAVESSKFRSARVVALTYIRKDEAVAVATSEEWSAVESTIEMFSAHIEFATWNLCLPDLLTCETVQLDKVADA